MHAEGLIEIFEVVFYQQIIFFQGKSYAHLPTIIVSLDDGQEPHRVQKCPT